MQLKISRSLKHVYTVLLATFWLAAAVPTYANSVILMELTAGRKLAGLFLEDLQNSPTTFRANCVAIAAFQ